MPFSWMNDLKLAAEFIRAIKTDCHHINSDLDDIARNIEEVARQYDEFAMTRAAKGYQGTQFPDS